MTNRENLGTIAFIGGGNMTRAIVGGLLAGGFDTNAITIAEPLESQRETLAGEFPGVTITPNNDDAAARSDTVVLAVKPQVLAEVCRGLAGVVQAKRPLVISIAAGTRSDDIDAWLGGGLPVVRVMPNQPALLRKGVAGLFANSRTNDAQKRVAAGVLAATGPVVEVASEADIDTVTAVSGSGPAYFYLLIDMLVRTGADLGLDEHDARTLAVATAEGAAALAAISAEPMETLIARVRSPGGTTAAALDSLEESDIRAIFEKAIRAACERANALADEAHEQGQE